MEIRKYIGTQIFLHQIYIILKLWIQQTSALKCKFIFVALFKLDKIGSPHFRPPLFSFFLHNEKEKWRAASEKFKF